MAYSSGNYSNRDKRFSKAEEEGRKRFYEDFNKANDITFTEAAYCPVDAVSVAKKGGHKCVVELKCYCDPAHPRNHDKFQDYQIDFGKCFNVVKAAEQENAEPLLVVYFSDKRVIWNLNKSDWKDRGDWVWTNENGQEYGKYGKWTYQTHLLISEAVDIR